MNYLCTLLLNLNPGKGSLGTPYDSSHGIPDHVKLILLLVLLMYGLYIALRVWLLNRKEKRNDKNKMRPAQLIKQGILTGLNGSGGTQNKRKRKKR